MVDYRRSLKVRNHMRASDAISPKTRIAKAARRIGELKRVENTDGAKFSTTSISEPVSRSEMANLRTNWLESAGNIAAREVPIRNRAS
jgi:hypothetical protein